MTLLLALHCMRSGKPRLRFCEEHFRGGHSLPTKINEYLPHENYPLYSTRYTKLYNLYIHVKVGLYMYNRIMGFYQKRERYYNKNSTDSVAHRHSRRHWEKTLKFRSLVDGSGGSMWVQRSLPHPELWWTHPDHHPSCAEGKGDGLI